MIDISLVERSFEEYVKNFDQNDHKTKLKINHTKRVVEVTKYLCQSLNLPLTETNLAVTIAYLHDFGRFEQIKRFNTFYDNENFNHADYAVEVLFEENKIRDFVEESKFDDIISFAILNHNRKVLKASNNNEQDQHAKLIRDADKIDIMHIYAFEESMPKIFKMDELPKGPISDDVFDDFLNEKVIDVKQLKTGGDLMVLMTGFIFDLNYKASLDYVREKNFVNIILSKLVKYDQETTSRIFMIGEKAKAFLNKNY